MKGILINEEFLETIRTYRSFHTFESEETHNVVPPILRHENLLNLRSIDKIIIKRYIEDNKRFMTKEEWLKLPKDLDYNIYRTAISPFPYLISGAYHSRINLYIKLNALLHPYEKLSLKGNSNLKNLSDLKSYFSEYAQGFFQGFNEFEDNFIKPLLINLGIPDKQGYATEVFKFITKDLSKETMTTSGRGFTTTYIGDGIFKINNGHPDGVYEGYIYRAWSIIFSQNELFLPIFKKYLNGDNTIQLNKADLVRDDILQMDNNLIPNVKIKYVYDFFKILKSPNKKGSRYLSEQKLLIFIKSTFIDKKPIKQAFDVVLYRDKKDITSVFRRFQDNCCDFDHNQKNIKTRYTNIMFNGFKGFNHEADFKNWHETNTNLTTIPRPDGNYLEGKSIIERVKSISLSKKQ